MRNGLALTAVLAGAVLLAGCDSKPAASGPAAQAAAPEGTISDELPDLDLLPNDAPLADPADQAPVPAVPGDPAAPVSDGSADAAPAAPAPAVPADAEPFEGSIAE